MLVVEQPQTPRWLRFGKPAREIVLDRWRRVAERPDRDDKGDMCHSGYASRPDPNTNVATT